MKRAAKVRGVSEAEYIRGAIARELTTGGNQSGVPDPTALDEIIRFARTRREHGSNGKPARWKRQDAYEERENKLASHYKS